jgi:hypothetical protein
VDLSAVDTVKNRLGITSGIPLVPSGVSMADPEFAFACASGL